MQRPLLLTLLALGPAVPPAAAEGPGETPLVRLEAAAAAPGQPLSLHLKSPLVGRSAVFLVGREGGARVLTAPLPVVGVTGSFLTVPTTVSARGEAAFQLPLPAALPAGTRVFAQALVREGTFWHASKPLSLVLGAGPASFQPAPTTLDAQVDASSGDTDWADLDRDGDLDALVLQGGRVLCLMNSPAGLLDEGPQRLPASVAQRTQRCVDFADVDLDGDVDVFVAGASESTDTAPAGDVLLLNDGSGHFTEQPSFPVGVGAPSDAAFGDLDGDGDPDLVIVNQQDPLFPSEVPGETRVYLNQGGAQGGALGAFALFNQLPVEPGADSHFDGGALELADFNQDGHLDIVFALGDFTTGGAQDRLFVGDGTGNFTDVTAASLPDYPQNTHDVAVADFDGDGLTDILFATTATSSVGVRYLLGRGADAQGNPIFEDATARMPVDLGPTTHIRLCVAAGDADGDGDPDAIFGTHGLPIAGGGFAGDVALLINQGGAQGGTQGDLLLDTTFTAGPPGIEGDVSFVDFDGDGDMDVYVSRSSSFSGPPSDQLLVNQL